MPCSRPVLLTGSLLADYIMQRTDTRSENAAQNSLSICRTCPRYQCNSGSFAREMAPLLNRVLHVCRIRILLVTCLGSCRNPGALAFDSPGKHRLRLSGLRSEQVEAIVSAVDAYCASSTGEIDLDTHARALRNHLSAVSPKRKIAALAGSAASLTAAENVTLNGPGRPADDGFAPLN